MTTESTQPPTEAVQSQAVVPGQSQGHRRRRRRRKTKANPAMQAQNQVKCKADSHKARPTAPSRFRASASDSAHRPLRNSRELPESGTQE